MEILKDFLGVLALCGACAYIVYGFSLTRKIARLENAKNAEHLALYQDIRRMLEHKCICVCAEEDL